MAAPNTFHDQRRRATRGTWTVLAALALLYFATFAVFGLVLREVLRLFTATSEPSVSAETLLLLTALAAAAFAAAHYADARRNGAAQIIAFLSAKPPNPADRHHQRFANMTEEMRIAAGLPAVRCLVAPSVAVNSLAVAEPDGTPVVIVAEGMLAGLTRAQLQGAIAHELAHVIEGDLLFVTTLCSVVNWFEQLRRAWEPDTSARRQSRADEPLGVLLYGYVAIVAAAMRLLSTMVSREREFVADATAVRLTRDPVALAGAIYRAHSRRSFLGDFSAGHAPMFIVAPTSEGLAEHDGIWASLFSTHPPLRARLEALSRMAGVAVEELVAESDRAAELAEEARVELAARGEAAPPVAAPRARSVPVAGLPAHVVADSRRWMARNGSSPWEGPYTAAELASLPNFSLRSEVRAEPGGSIEYASSVGALRDVMAAVASRRSQQYVTKPQAGTGACPGCGTLLDDARYEGAPLRRCPGCGGRFVSRDAVRAILARREVRFAPELHARAEQFRTGAIVNPFNGVSAGSGAGPGRACPGCGHRMLSRPFSYAYFLPVEECFGCQSVWLEGDALELLQVLVEDGESAG